MYLYIKKCFRYKTPLLRGNMDPGIDKFEVIEKLMADDLENWLCNFYFEIVKLPRYYDSWLVFLIKIGFYCGCCLLLLMPLKMEQIYRYMAGQKEYEVELQFTSGLLGAPTRTIAEEENIDGEKLIFGSRSEVNFPENSHLSIRVASVASSGNNSTEKPSYLHVEEEKESASGSSGHKVFLISSLF